MSNHPFFSVVIPVYNRSGIIHTTISSILNQGYKDFEIIVVDDGSTDNSTDVITELAGDHSNIKLIKQENRERGAARNNGYSHSNGNYIIFFDSDDYMHDDHLELLNRFIHEQNFPLYIATKFDFVTEEGKHFQSDMKSLRQGYYDYRLFLKGNSLACNICVKKDNPEFHLFEEDRRYAIKEDWMFMLQNLQKHRLYIVDKVTISMLDHPNRSMRSENIDIINRTLLASEWILKKVKLSASERNELRSHVNYFCGIHYYLDYNKKESIKYVMKAIKSGGLKLKYIILLIKAFAGRKIISILK